MTKLLLSHGADVNHTSHHSSPLIYASEYNNVELTALLLEHGASVKEVGLQGILAPKHDLKAKTRLFQLCFSTWELRSLAKQWTYGPMLLPWRSHLHTALRLF